jgi:hypothetical protein
LTILIEARVDDRPLEDIRRRSAAVDLKGTGRRIGASLPLLQGALR